MLYAVKQGSSCRETNSEGTIWKFVTSQQSIKIDYYKSGTRPPEFDPRDVFPVLIFSKTVFNVNQFKPLTSPAFNSLLP
jgi:hypothetical protein